MERSICNNFLIKISKSLHTNVPKCDNNTFNIFTVLGVETKEVILCRPL